MKNFLFIALLAGTTALEAAAQTPVQAGDQTPGTTQTGKTKKRKYTPEVYKGTVAKQRRIVTDATGAQNDKDDDVSTSKSEKSSKKQ